MPWMEATPGITEPHFSRDPLGTEAELTPGADDRNPFDERRERGEYRLEEDIDRGDGPFQIDMGGADTAIDFALDLGGFGRFSPAFPEFGDGPRF